MNNKLLMQWFQSSIITIVWLELIDISVLSFPNGGINKVAMVKMALLPMSL